MHRPAKAAHRPRARGRVHNARGASVGCQHGECLILIFASFVLVPVRDFERISEVLRAFTSAYHHRMRTYAPWKRVAESSFLHFFHAISTRYSRQAARWVAFTLKRVVNELLLLFNVLMATEVATCS